MAGLILVGVATFFAEPRNKAAFREVDDCWFGPESSEEFVEVRSILDVSLIPTQGKLLTLDFFFIQVLGAIADFLLGDKRPGEDQVRIKDWLIGTVARKYNPYAGRHIWMAGVPNHRVCLFIFEVHRCLERLTDISRLNGTAPSIDS